MADRSQLRLAAFLEALEELWGRDAEFLQAAEEGEPPLHVIVHHDSPAPGLVTSVTYGISIQGPRSELVLQVDSRDIAWPLALGQLARTIRGRDAIHEGELFDLGQPVAAGSALSGFMVHRACDFPEGAPQLDLPGGPLAMLQLYPLHPGEIARARRDGIGWLLTHRGWEPTRVGRPDLS